MWIRRTYLNLWYILSQRQYANFLALNNEKDLETMTKSLAMSPRELKLSFKYQFLLEGIRVPHIKKTSVWGRRCIWRASNIPQSKEVTKDPSPCQKNSVTDLKQLLLANVRKMWASLKIRTATNWKALNVFKYMSA